MDDQVIRAPRQNYSPNSDNIRSAIDMGQTAELSGAHLGACAWHFIYCIVVHQAREVMASAAGAKDPAPAHWSRYRRSSPSSVQ
jgi:hypothetical protein